MKNILTVAAFTLAGFLLPAAVLAQSNTDADVVQPGSYTLDPTHTLARFSVDHFGISEFFGTFPGATGTLSIDPKSLATARLDVSVPVATVSTTNKALDAELASADWLDAAKFPAMRFVSTKVTRTGKSTATIAGTLTLHGVTRPVTLNATFHGGAVNPMKKLYSIGFKATGTIKRSEYGVTKYVPLVSDETQLTITAAFEKTAG